MPDAMIDMIPFSGLRGVCAMAIFLGHETDIFLRPISSTQTVLVGLEYLQAVSLFFLLSGIPLARLYSTTGKVETWNGCFQFWRKRCARLMPIYYLALLLNLGVVIVICEQLDIGAALESFAGCALFLQSWFVSLINVGGVLWQVAVFMFGYLAFPFLSRRVAGKSALWLHYGILLLWLASLALWFICGAIFPHRLAGWWVWHVHCLSRLPHIFAGVLLGELVEMKRNDIDDGARAFWSTTTDTLSVVLIATAVQAPILQWYYGTEVRSDVSIMLEAWLLPLHAAWLAGMVLAYQGSDIGDVESQHSVSTDNYRKCWTRQVLSFKPLIALGDVSLVLYCLHLVVLFLYASTYAYITTGDRQIAPSIFDYTLKVQIPWWHAPIQWFLVILVSFAVSKWFEAPLRKILSSGSGQRQGTVFASEQTRLIAYGSDGHS